MDRKYSIGDSGKDRPWKKRRSSLVSTLQFLVDLKSDLLTFSKSQFDLSAFVDSPFALSTLLMGLKFTNPALLDQIFELPNF